MKLAICLAAALMMAPAALAQWAAPSKSTAAQAKPSSDQAQQAATPDKASPASMPSFATIDADHSGSLSLDELKTVDASLTQEQFDKYDANHDQKLSKVEFGKMQKDMAAANPTATKKSG